MLLFHVIPTTRAKHFVVLVSAVADKRYLVPIEVLLSLQQEAL